MDPEVDGLAFRSSLLAEGVTDDELRRMCRQRRLTTIRPGAYVPSSDARLATARARHALAARSSVPRWLPTPCSAMRRPPSCMV